jgi:hypothetical protein
MGTIQKLTENCSRADCSISGGVQTSTLIGWVPTFDKHGNQTGSDPNIYSGSYQCLSCGTTWHVKEQYGEVTIKAVMQKPD